MLKMILFQLLKCQDLQIFFIFSHASVVAPDWNISTTSGWVGMAVCGDICGPLRMNLYNSGDLWLQVNVSIVQ